MHRIPLLLLVIPILYFSSCKPLTSTVMFQSESDYEYAREEGNQKQITIKPGDQLSILMSTNGGLVLLESTLGLEGNNHQINQQQSSITYLIEQDSMVKLPTVGRVKLGGVTLREAEELLETKFSENYQKPFVKLKITNRKVIMFFEEGTQGKIISLPEENMTLIDAIATAGGVTKNSKSYNIKILRGDPANPTVINFNIRNIKEFKNANLLLEANDIIYVETRPRYVFKIISELQPYLVLISTTVLVYSFFNQVYK